MSNKLETNDSPASTTSTEENGIRTNDDASILVIASDSNFYEITANVWQQAEPVKSYVPREKSLNLVGPALTKVVSWNVAGTNLATGFQLDLRKFHLRPFTGYASDDTLKPVLLPDEYDPTEKVPDNIYVIFWKPSVSPFSTDYSVRFISSDIVTQTPIKEPEELNAQRISAFDVLKYTFLLPGVQSGAVTKDNEKVIGTLTGGICYVANLASFRNS